MRSLIACPPSSVPRNGRPLSCPIGLKLATDERSKSAARQKLQTDRTNLVQIRGRLDFHASCGSWGFNGLGLRCGKRAAGCEQSRENGDGSRDMDHFSPIPQEARFVTTSKVLLNGDRVIAGTCPAADEGGRLRLFGGRKRHRPLAQFSSRLPDDDPRALQREGGHDGRDDDVGPAGSRAEDAKRREQDREIADHIIAGANPYRPHVAVAMQVGPKQSEARCVREERRQPTAPMVIGSGTVPATACQTTVAKTQTPNKPIVAPFASAAIAR